MWFIIYNYFSQKTLTSITYTHDKHKLGTKQMRESTKSTLIVVNYTKNGMLNVYKTAV